MFLADKKTVNASVILTSCFIKQQRIFFTDYLQTNSKCCLQHSINQPQDKISAQLTTPC